MTKQFIWLFLIVFAYFVWYIISILIKRRTIESFNQSDGRLSMMDSHYYLTTAILPGKVDIVNLKEHNPNHTEFYYVDPSAVTTEQTDPNVVSHKPSVLSKSPVTCIANNPLISKYKPYILGDNIVNYYDHPFYWDWRYPERPIDVKFATNPISYCRLNSNVYPCYKMWSKW